jgi:recombination associated protein RdgC
MVRTSMPVLRGAVTFARFRLEAGALPRDLRRWLARGLARGAFEPLDVRRGDEDRAAGFVTLEEAAATDFGAVLERGRALFAYRVDTLRVKAAAVRTGLTCWSAAFADEHGRPPARGERATARDQIRHELRQRTEPVTRVSDVSWNLESRELQVWAASRKAVEEIAAAVEVAFEVRLAPASVGAQAARARLPEEALAPTPELVGLEGEEEVGHGEA